MYRVDEFRRRFKGAALITDEKNIYYLTGFTGEGSLVITPSRALIITDFRYVEQCQRQAPETEMSCVQANLTRDDIVKKVLIDEGISELFIEDNVLTVQAYNRLSQKLEGVKLSPIDDTCRKMRVVKSEEELGYIAKALSITCQAFENMLGQLKPGITEKHARAILEHEMALCGSEGNAFDTIVASGANGSLPHAVPSDKIIQSGELFTFDFGATWKGYCADMTRTVAVGNISDDLKKIYDAVYTAHMNALEAVKPGMVCKDLDAIARNYLEDIYPGTFGHSLGHGVGLNIHESPAVSWRSDTVLEPGHVITIEPGVYLPGLGGCRIEDTVFVTQDGYRDVCTVSKQLLVV